jgi:predicted aconitase with swiveling domain
MGLEIRGTPLISGEATGQLLVSDEPLSFWGGYDYKTGTIIDQRHPLAGERAAGRILALPFTRGSSSTTAVLLEAVKAGTAPTAILSTEPDTFFALASIVSDEMYGKTIPLVQLSVEDFRKLLTGRQARVTEHGVVTID